MTTSATEDLALEPGTATDNDPIDEQATQPVPVAEAFTLAQQQIAAATPEQAQLPGVVLPFNFQGAYLELEEKAVEVDRLHAEHKAAAEAARDAKKAWDQAAELYTRMALELRRRRRAKEGQPAEDLIDASERPANLVRCKWEEAHPGESCPICSDDTLKPETARDSVAHIDEVVELLEVRSAVAVSDALEAIGILVPIEYIRKFSDEDRAEVKAWAEFDRASTEPVPPRPAILGSGHIASPYVDGQSEQYCTQCDAVLIEAPADGDQGNYYVPGTLVGTDCKGKPPARYAGRRNKVAKKEATE